VKIDVAAVANALLVTIVNFALATTLLYLTFNWSGQSTAFWLCLAPFVMMGAIVFVAWLASTDRTDDWVGVAIILGLLVLGAVGYGWASNSGLLDGWSWPDFGKGAVCLVIIGIACVINLIYKRILK